jgi:hypothetical protein
MGQADFERELCDTLTGELFAGGLASNGTYQANSMAPTVPCRMLIDSATGEQVVSYTRAPGLLERQARIRLLRSEIDLAPRRGAIIIGDGKIYQVDKLELVDPGFWTTLCEDKGFVE